MLPLIIGLLLIITGLGTVAWLMWNEKKQLAGQEVQTNTEKDPKPDLTPASLLKKLGLEEEKPKTDELPGKSKKNIFSKFLPSLTKKLSKQDLIQTPLPTKLPEEFNRVSAKSTTGTASLRLDQDLSLPTTPTEASPVITPTPTPTLSGLEAESDWAFRYDELQKERDSLKERFERLDSLFKEKGDSFDKSEKALASEIKNRKEFNKVKDILEKELKENRDKCRELEVRVSGAQTESSAYLKRVNQLEEKIKKLEKEILDKENEMKEAQGQIQGRQKLITELEEKLKTNEKLIQEKNEKINEIVGKMKNGGTTTSEPSPTENAPDAPPPEAPAVSVVKDPPSPVVEIPPATVTVSETTAPVSGSTADAPVQTEEPIATPVVTEPATTATLEPPTEIQPPATEPTPEPLAAAPEPPPTQPEPQSEPVPTSEPAQPQSAQPSEEAPAVERGNIILQAIEKNQSPAAESTLKVETPEPPPPSESESVAIIAPKETPANHPEETPPIKLAPDILAEQPKESKPADTDNPPSEKSEPPNVT